MRGGDIGLKRFEHLAPCLVALFSLACGFSQASEMGLDALAGHSCGVRCAGYLEARLLQAPPPVRELRDALGTADEAASLGQIQRYLEGRGLHTMSCHWTVKAIARWEGDLYAIVHLAARGDEPGHFVVVEKDAEGITVVDWPNKRRFSNTWGGRERWRDYVAQQNMTKTALLVSRDPIVLPARAGLFEGRLLYWLGGGATALLALFFNWRRNRRCDTSQS